MLLATGLIGADWWFCLPQDAQATYVGRSSCIECHTHEAEQWAGSYHDLAMDRATPQSVLGDFDNAQLSHFGITSRMYRDNGKYRIQTEGPDGEMGDFEIKYVLGVHPLQQYMVEFDRPEGASEGAIGRVQVLRVSWDTVKKEWFYLSPPDVQEKLSPDDPLHWTGRAQNWNHMCAECHSTNVQKNFDVETKQYHTTFSEMDVSCEACHGPASIHVQLARSRSLFWDRHLGYGLARLKAEDSRVQIETCAPCHSRRHLVCPDYKPGSNYYQHYVNELLEPATYYPDGQVLDEVYEYGSFIQSKMYDQGVRCTDCHNPHTTELRYQGNRVCTSCHTHDPAKYDTPAHHRHLADSAGASCVECHMSEWPFMQVDPRRDHSFRVPRPDLSVKLRTPNACTACHLDRATLAPEQRSRLRHYADWLAAARAGDQDVADQLARLDRWAMETVRQWYGEKKDAERVEFAETLRRAWQHDPAVVPELIRLVGNRRASGIVRASALEQLMQFPSGETFQAAQAALKDADPQVRAGAIRNLPNEHLPRRELLDQLTPLLGDPIGTVRVEAARALASLPREAFSPSQYQQLQAALDDFRGGLSTQADQAGAHLGLGALAESQGELSQAIASYQTAMRVQPHVTGPRTNLAALLERLGRDPAEVQRLRREELDLLVRDAKLVPQSAILQYRVGLSLYLHERENEAEASLRRACALEPNVPEYVTAVTLLLKKQRRWDEAMEWAAALVKLRPHDPTFRQIYQEVRQGAAAGALPQRLGP
jgi:predicted CXXCH cytochrome family protein